jgi:hypothetical protein
MRQQWPALQQDGVTYRTMIIWQDGSGPQSGRHPSLFEHIMGPKANETAESEASDFWSFAWAWGRGLHSSTFQLNLSRVRHKNAPYTP